MLTQIRSNVDMTLTFHTEILDWINGISESNINEDENLFLLNDLCDCFYQHL